VKIVFLCDILLTYFLFLSLYTVVVLILRQSSVSIKRSTQRSDAIRNIGKAIHNPEANLPCTHQALLRVPVSCVKTEKCPIGFEQLDLIYRTSPSVSLSPVVRLLSMLIDIRVIGCDNDWCVLLAPDADHVTSSVRHVRRASHGCSAGRYIQICTDCCEAWDVLTCYNWFFFHEPWD